MIRLTGLDFININPSENNNPNEPNEPNNPNNNPNAPDNPHILNTETVLSTQITCKAEPPSAFNMMHECSPVVALGTLASWSLLELGLLFKFVGTLRLSELGKENQNWNY